MKEYIIIAGFNGSGKSTLYQSLSGMHGMERVNIDEIVREIGIWNNPGGVVAAGKTAVKKIHDYFSQGISFNQETTLCGKTILNNMNQAYTQNVAHIVLSGKDRAITRILK